MVLRGYRISRHAAERAVELGFSLEEVADAAADPHLSYEQSGKYAGQQMRIRGDVAVAVEPASSTVITVVLRRLDRWEHGADTRTR